MNNGLTELRDIAALDAFLAQSVDSPVVIFKHSQTCGISDRAYDEILKLAGLTEASALPIGIVAVQAARDVSNEIEGRTGVTHETPQVFVMMNGQVIWSASHSAIRAEAIAKAIIAAGAPDR